MKVRLVIDVETHGVRVKGSVGQAIMRAIEHAITAIKAVGFPVVRLISAVEVRR